MSVLFKALQKNARARERGSERGFVPLMTLPNAQASAFSWKGFFIICLTLGFGVLGYVLHDLSGTTGLSAIASAQASSQVSVANASLPHPKQSALPNPKQSALPRHGRKIEDEPQGIAVTMDALSGTRETGEDAQKSRHVDMKDAKDRDEVDDLAAQIPAKSLKDRQDPAFDETRRDVAMSSQISQGSLHIKVEEGPAKEPKTDDLLRQARQALDARAFAQAEKIYTRILEKTPSRKDALDGLVYTLSQTPNAETLTRLIRLAQSNPESANIQAALAEAHMKQGSSQAVQAAIGYWWAAIALDPNNDKYRLALAVLLDRRDETDAALNLYRQIKEPRPESVKRRLAYLEAQEAKESEETQEAQESQETQESKRGQGLKNEQESAKTLASEDFARNAFKTPNSSR